MSKRVNNKQINKVKYNLQQAGDILLVYLIDEFLIYLILLKMNLMVIK